MAKTKYPCVYQDAKGHFSYLIELGLDKVTGKRILKKEQKTGQENGLSQQKQYTKKSCVLKVSTLKVELYC